MISRRRLLAAAGAAVAAPLAVWLGVSLVDDDPQDLPDTRLPWDDHPDDVAGRPGQYAYGAPTAELLARTADHLAAPRGTLRTPYEEGSPPDDATWDLRGARFIGYFDADALYETGEFSGGSTEEQKNNRPIRLGDDEPIAGAALIGGVVEGAQPTTLTWERMKYGQQIQDDTDRWIDAGRPDSVDPHEAQVDNRNQDGDARIYLRPDSWAVWDGVRVRNTHDGIGLYGDIDDRPGTCYVRNCWLQDIRDDAIENDDWHHLHVYDTLVEGTYTFLSSNQDAEESGATRTITVEDSIVRLRAYPGGFETRSTDAVHGAVYKSRDNSPALQLRNVVIAAERFRGGDDRDAVLPTRRGRTVDRYENVTLVWLGKGRYPGNVPAGCTLTTDRSVYDDAVTDWKARHGVTSFEDVDLAAMIEPEPVVPADR